MIEIAVVASTEANVRRPIDWPDFVAGAWERHPARLRPRFAEPLATESEIFECFLRARGDDSRTLYFNSRLENGGYTQQGDGAAPQAVRPCEADASFAGYAKRMRSHLEGQPFCVRLTNPHVHSPRIWCRLRTMVEDLFASIGGRRSVQTVVFVGNYDFTPAGVHTDGEPLFQYCVSGRRSGYFWDPSTWEARDRDPHAPDSYATEGRVFDLREGEMVYWPTGHYHVFRSLGLSIGLTIGLPSAPPDLDDPGAVTARLVWESASGFLRVASADPSVALVRGDRLRGDPRFPIRIHASSGALVFAAAGHAFEVPVSGGVLALIERCNTGEVFRADEQIEPYVDDGLERTLQQVLLSLLSVAAVTRV